MSLNYFTDDLLTFIYSGLYFWNFSHLDDESQLILLFSYDFFPILKILLNLCFMF